MQPAITIAFRICILKEDMERKKHFLSILYLLKIGTKTKQNKKEKQRKAKTQSEVKNKRKNKQSKQKQKHKTPKKRNN